MERARAALATATGAAQREALQAALQQLELDQTEANERLANSDLTAPVDGVVLLPELPLELEAGARFARVMDPQRHIEVSGALPPGLTRATLKLGHVERPVPVEDGRARVTLAPELVDAQGELLVPGGSRPWLLHRLGR